MRHEWRFEAGRGLTILAGLGMILSLLTVPSRAQGPSPESAPTLFPGGALVSYNSIFQSRRAAGNGAQPLATARPTLQHEAQFTFVWGIWRDWQLAVVAPIATTRFKPVSAGPSPLDASRLGGTGLGDTLLLMKYRFLRIDSERGTTQASLTIGPKLPTGRTHLRDASGALLPVGLQPGSGSTDVLLGATFTYTGLLHIKRLVADGSLASLVTTRGAQQVRLGSSLESRFWLSYRPYQSLRVGREWFIGPALAWHHFADDEVAGARQRGSGGDVLLLGPTSYVGVRPGMHVWLALDCPLAQTRNGIHMETRRRISFGITQQFRLHH